MNKLQNRSSIADKRGYIDAVLERLFSDLSEQEREICDARTSAGGYENSNEIGVSNVGDRWLVSHTSLTHG